MKNKTLMQICDEMVALDDLISDLDGDVSDPRVEQAIDEWFAENDRDLKSKVDAYVALIKEMLLRSEARKNEAERMAKLAKSDAMSAQHLKWSLQYVLDRIGITKIKTDRFNVSIALNGGKLPVSIMDESNLDDKYFIVTKRADKDAIRQDLENGIDVPGCELMDRGKSLRIR